MDESKEFKGIWYLPNNRDNAVAGTLYYRKQKDIYLELIGNISPKRNPIEVFFDDELKNPQILYGETSDALMISLINCHRGETSLNFSCTFPLISFSCQFIIIGSHISNINDKCFSSIRVKLDALSQWLIPGLIERKYYDNGDSTGYEIKVSTNQKAPLKIELNPSFILSLISQSSIIGDINYPHVLKVNQFTFFEIKSIKENVSFYELYEQADLFIQFLSFTALNAQSPSEITLYNNNDIHEPENEIKNTLLFIDRYKNYHEKKIDFLFNYKLIEHEFPGIIQKWYSTRSDIAPIKSHLLNSIQQKSVFTSLDFLIIVQSLEGYHRRFVKPNQKEWIKLKDRLNDLISYHSLSIEKIKNYKWNIQAIIDTRDYFSHFFPRNTKPYLIEGYELFKLTKILRILLICCILDLTGFTDEKINDIVNNCKNSKLNQ